MSWNNITPWWMIGNPYGPVPPDGKYYYFDENDKRIGPFDTKEEAQKDKDAYREMQNLR